MKKLGYFHKQKLDKNDIPGGWPPEASAIEDLIDEYRKVSVDLSKCISNCIPSLGIPDVEKRAKKIPEHKVGVMFIEASNKFQSAKPELRDVYFGIGDATADLVRSRRDFESGVEEKIVNHLKKLADDELPEIQKERKALSKCCNELKSANERLENTDAAKQPSEKMQQLRSTQEELEQKANQQKDQTLKMLFQFDARCRENSLHILEYLKLLEAYHERCTQILKTKIPVIEEHIELSMVSPVFRTPLRQHLAEAKTDIAYVLKVCIEALNKESALKEEGIFRTAGSKTKVDILTHALDAKRANSLIHECESSVIADALKQYFRFMEEPLLLSSLFDDWMKAMQHPVQEDRMRALWNVLHTLPEENRTNLCYLIKFLAKVSTFSEHNRMTPANLGIVFGPNLLKPSTTNGAFGMMSTGVQSAIVELMITHADWFFPNTEDMFTEFTKEPEAPLPPQPVVVQPSYVNLGLEPANGPPAEERMVNASPSAQRKMQLSARGGSFSPGSSQGTLQRRKAQAPPPPPGQTGRLGAGDEAPLHAKSMPSVLATPGGSVVNINAGEDGCSDANISVNTGEGTVKLDRAVYKTRTDKRRTQSVKVARGSPGSNPNPNPNTSFNMKSSTMPSRPASMPPKPPLAVAEAPPANRAPPPRPKKPSFTPPAPPADHSPPTEVSPSPPPRPPEPPEPRRSAGSTTDPEPESTHL